MGTPVPVSGRPAVSVIVPARNEEACLPHASNRSSRRREWLFEIIVVDDASTDRTRSIADSFPEVRVVDPGPLPPGGPGKITPSRLVQRWRAENGSSLPTRTPCTNRVTGAGHGGNRRAPGRLALLLPEQEVHGLWEKAIMPVDLRGTGLVRTIPLPSAIRIPPPQRPTDSIC